MWFHATSSPLYNWYLNNFRYLIDKHLVIETSQNESVKSQIKETLQRKNSQDIASLSKI